LFDIQQSSDCTTPRSFLHYHRPKLESIEALKNIELASHLFAHGAMLVFSWFGVVVILFILRVSLNKKSRIGRYFDEATLSASE
jgi:hypothetical protein